MSHCECQNSNNPTRQRLTNSRIAPTPYPGQMSSVPKADVGRRRGTAPERSANYSAKRPSAISDDLATRASGITGVAHREPSSFRVATVRFDKKTRDRQIATRLPWAQIGPVTIFYGRSSRRIQAPRGLITEIVGQIGTDDEQCFRAAP
jgi:hypothetical protein